MGFWPWRRSPRLACAWLVTYSVGTSGQNNASNLTAPSSSSSSSSFTTTVVISTTTGLKTTTTTTEPDWPACPALGCLPCPDNAIGRPNCTCIEGYTLTGKASDANQQIPWGRTRGWLGRCLPVACGVPPVLPHAERADNVHVEDSLVYPERARYLCNDGYEAAGASSAGSGASPVRIALGNFTDEALSDRLIETQCTSNGTLSSLELMLCVPICGDGRLMETDHLPLYDLREQCDDGNRLSSDGCSLLCAVESGWVCTGGTPSSPDTCKQSEVWTDSTLVLRISGHRLPSEEEIADATLIAMAESVGTVRRDLEVLEVKMSLGEGGLAEDGDSDSTTTSVSEISTTTSRRSYFHGAEVSVQVRFRVKISDPNKVTIKQVAGMLRTPSLMKPKLWVAYAERTSFSDLYVQVVDVSPPTIEGDESKGVPKGFTLSGQIKKWTILLSPVYSYIFLISFVAPSAWWCFRIRRRKYTLDGRFRDVAPEFKGNWAFNICTCLENKCLFVSLICCLPARMADTWDALGFVQYWAGVRRAVCCCVFYLCGLGFCGALVPAKYRSDMRDFFGFGDAKEGNTEFADVCCYILCPLCCVVQEARHVDSALAVLPAPQNLQEAEYQYDIQEHMEHEEHPPAQHALTDGA